MAHLNDSKYSWIASQVPAASGGVSGLERAWLQEVSGSTGHLNDQWNEYLTSLGYTTGALPDKMGTWLTAEGYAGSLSDKLAAFFRDFYQSFVTQSTLNGTYTRPSGALRRDSDNNLRTAGLNIPVFDGRRLSGQNLIKYSNKLDEAVWAKSTGASVVQAGDSWGVTFAQLGNVTTPYQQTYSVSRNVASASIAVYETPKKQFFPFTDANGKRFITSFIAYSDGSAYTDNSVRHSVAESSFIGVKIGVYSGEPITINCKDFNLSLVNDSDVPDIGVVVCLGDSISLNYPAVISELLYKTTVVNSAIGGNTIQQMIDRFAADVASHNPDAIIAQFGANSITSLTIAELKAQSETLINLCKDTGATVIIGENIPRTGVDADYRAKQKELNEWFYTQGVQVIPLFDEYLDPGTEHDLIPITTPDGLHPSINGSWYYMAGLYAEALGRSIPTYIKTTDTAPVNVTSPYDLSGNLIAGLKGISIHPAIVNLLWHIGFNAPDLSGMTDGGDAARVVGLVDYTTELTSAGLIGLQTSGEMVEINNLLGSVPSYIDLTGPLSVAAHSMDAHIIGGTGNIGFSDGTGQTAFAASASVVRRFSLNKTPTLGTELMRITADAGQKIAFLIPCAVARSTAPQYPVPANSLTTSTTQSATVLELPFPTGSRRAVINYTHYALETGVTRWLFGNRTDANNYVGGGINGTIAFIEKMTGGVSEITSVPLAPVTDTEYEVIAGFNPDNTMFISVDGVAHTVDGSTILAPVLNSTFELGSMDGSGQVDGQFKSIQIRRG